MDNNTEIVELVKKKKLTGKQKAFISEYIKNGKNGVRAALKVYNAANYNTASAISSENLQKPNIQSAIDAALTYHEATPEFAVGRLKSIAAQEEEIGAARLAAKDILELHGWRKDERPQMSLSIKNAFFGQSRDKAQTPIDGEVVEP